jgi:predicted enzyme related to lactoylglutathione lyase
MITAIHAVLYSREATAARAFFRDALQLPHVDAGDGWLIFALPPAELGVHPTHTDHGPELYFMCDDVEQTLVELRGKGVTANKPVIDQGWGLLTTIRIPGGVEVGLYEPRHPIAAQLVTTKPKTHRPKPRAPRTKRRR